MSKACQTREEAEATVRYYKEEKARQFLRGEGGEIPSVREGDRKTLKSINYSLHLKKS